MSNQEALQRLIFRLITHQKAMGLSDEKFVARYSRHINSVKTWRTRLCEGQVDAKDHARWAENMVKKLTAFVSELDGGSAPIVFWDDMPFARKVDARLSILQGQTTDRRCLMVLATTGCGKSAKARREFESSPREMVYVRANESWREQKYQICSGIGKVLGIDVHSTGYNVVQAITDHLKKEPITIFIDEAHEGGVMLFKLIRTWIDETPVRFVYLAFATQYDKVIHSSTGAMAEAKQLLGRTLKPIFDEYRDGVGLPDVICYLKHAGLNGDAKPTAEKILHLVRDNGNLRVLADAIEEAQAIADEREEDLTGLHVVEGVENLCPQRKVVGK